jgi:hypothetical protein
MIRKRGASSWSKTWSPSTSRSRAAHAADTDVPSRLVVLYIPGGYRPAYYFTPMDDADIPLCVPAPSSYNGEPVFFDASKLVNLAPGNGPYKPLRTWQSWNPLNPAERGTFSPLMYGYSHFALHEQMSAIEARAQSRGRRDHRAADHGHGHARLLHPRRLRRGHGDPQSVVRILSAGQSLARAAARRGATEPPTEKGRTRTSLRLLHGGPRPCPDACSTSDFQSSRRAWAPL